MSDNPFSSETPPAETPPAEITIDTLTTKLADIKNEEGGVKYSDLSKALDALKESQSYIPNLKKEKEALEKELAEVKANSEKQESVEEVVQRLLEKQTKKTEEPAHQQEIKTLGEDDVAAIVSKTLTDAKTQEQLKVNEDTVAKALNEKFGEKSKEVVAAKAKELGMTPERIGELAAENPNIVLSLFSTSTKLTTPSESTVNTSQFQGRPQQELQKPEKSLLSGATANEQKAFMQEIKKRVYERHGVES